MTEFQRVTEQTVKRREGKKENVTNYKFLFSQIKIIAITKQKQK